MLDKAWVHLCRVDFAYESGARCFVEVVSAKLAVNGKIICSCTGCRNLERHTCNEVVSHLVIHGMDEAYKICTDWFHHGDYVGLVEGQDRVWNAEILGLYEDAKWSDEDLPCKGSNLCEAAEGEDRKEDEFLVKLAEAEMPLYPTCVNHSKLSATVTLFRIKTQNGWSDKSFDDLLETLSKMLPKDNVLHTSTYDVKKFLKSFDMGYQKIHACVNDCCLFRKKLKKVDTCPKCKSSRWKTNMHTGEVKKGVPHKVLRYFPIISRLKRMFRSEKVDVDLRWHFNNKSTDGKLRHPVDSVTWKSMNDKYPSFIAEQRNLRLGLSTDGFNPFNMKNS
ncbi:PREDICTED: uncharacterized protein LOC104783481 [Camelina sativa]|uniref:Uncharacterized protein LOC104783481 n=1 Tax=Camelina sativa TaxID=90675 RepID=A0ABM0YWK6_CAMSA|nr:PREDICTED: uncharacterized protein LOC104783481 [Camelina sativa]